MTVLMRNGDKLAIYKKRLVLNAPGCAVSLDCHTCLGWVGQQLQGITVL